MEKANNLLRQAGYYEERRVDISDILEMYEKYGYHCNDAQEAFMAHYAGIRPHKGSKHDYDGCSGRVYEISAG